MGCVEPYEPEYEESQPSLVVLAELQDGKKPNMSISTTFSINGAPQEIPAVGNDIIITNSEDGFEVPYEFRKTTSDQFNTPDNLIIRAGETYRLEAEIGNLDIAKLSGETTVPLAGEFAGGGTVTVAEQSVNNTLLDATFSVMAPPDPESYYHLIPYLKTSNFDSTYLDIVRVDQEDNTSFLLTHRHGILIDTDGLVDEIELSLTIRSLSGLDLNTLTDKNLYFELKTVTYDYYQYHRSISRQNLTNRSPFTIPVLSYTQFETGYGLFAGTSVNVHKIKIE